MNPPRFPFLLSLLASVCVAAAANAAEQRPNVLLILADNWAWPHASAYGDRVVQTPTFDRVAREGMLFQNAFCLVPSCAPSRAALLTGQAVHRLEAAASNWAYLSPQYATFPNLLKESGYTIGHSGKGWEPGSVEKRSPGYEPVGPKFDDFAAFLEQVPQGAPFCFWHGSRRPHRAWTEGTARSNRREDVEVPPYLPDTPEVRDDILAYYAEIETFDSEASHLLALLAERGLAGNTLVIVGSDNGWQMPRGLANVYDAGTHVPLAMRWPDQIGPGSKTDALINFDDWAPTLLAAAGCEVPKTMTGRSFLPLIKGEEYQPAAAVFLERERHANVRAGDLSYPMRAVRTRDFLYVRNFEPDRWPAGDPQLHWSVGPWGDVDPSPTKQLIIAGRNVEPLAMLYKLAFAKRPTEELYDLRRDPHQMQNVASDSVYAEAKQELEAQLLGWMQRTEDPRATNPHDERWDKFDYLGFPAKQLR